MPIAVFEPDNEEPVLTPSISWTTFALLLLMLACTGLLAFGVKPTLRFQPTVVGVVWGNIFLMGYLSSGIGRGSAWYALLTLPTVFFYNSAFDSLTDLGPADSVLVTAMLLLAGWATNLSDPASRISTPAETTQPAARVFRRWSIGDIGFLTMIAACMAHFWQHAEAASGLMVAVSLVLIGGVLCSWTACRIVWKDAWSLGNLAVLTGTLLCVLGVVVACSPPGVPLASHLRWAIQGPINVMAAQASVVLIVLACWRFDLSERDPKTVAIELKVFH